MFFKTKKRQKMEREDRSLRRNTSFLKTNEKKMRLIIQMTYMFFQKDGKKKRNQKCASVFMIKKVMSKSSVKIDLRKNIQFCVQIVRM